VQTYGRRRRLFSTLLTQPEQAHLTVFHLRSPRATETWLRAGLSQSQQRSGDRVAELGWIEGEVGFVA